MNAFERARSLANRRLKHYLNGTTPPVDRTLVIIDMQDNFLCSNGQRIVGPIRTLVDHAKSHEWSIIVVEMDGCCETDERITNRLIDYERYTTIHKDGCNGGRKVMEYVNSNPSCSLSFVVCGVYGPECVSATVAGIFEESALAEIDVVSDAVYPAYESRCDQEDDGYDPTYEPQCNQEDDGYNPTRERIVTLNDVINCNPVTVS